MINAESLDTEDFAWGWRHEWVTGLCYYSPVWEKKEEITEVLTKSGGEENGETESIFTRVQRFKKTMRVNRDTFDTILQTIQPYIEKPLTQRKNSFDYVSKQSNVRKSCHGVHGATFENRIFTVPLKFKETWRQGDQVTFESQ